MERKEREEQNQTLYKLLRTGDRVARKQLITSNMEWCDGAVDLFVSQTEAAAHLRDDLRSESYLALVEAVDELAGKADVEDVTKWLSKIIMRRMGEYESKQQLGPGRRRQNQLKGEYSEEYLQLEDDFIDGRITEDEYILAARELNERHDELRPSVEEVTEDNGGTYIDAGFNLVDLEDALAAACQDDLDHQIIAFRKDGFTDTEIGEKLNLSQPTISRRRHAIGNRFNELTGTEEKNVDAGGQNPSLNTPSHYATAL